MLVYQVLIYSYSFIYYMPSAFYKAILNIALISDYYSNVKRSTFTKVMNNNLLKETTDFCFY